VKERSRRAVACFVYTNFRR